MSKQVQELVFLYIIVVQVLLQHNKHKDNTYHMASHQLVSALSSIGPFVSIIFLIQIKIELMECCQQFDHNPRQCVVI